MPTFRHLCSCAAALTAAAALLAPAPAHGAPARQELKPASRAPAPPDDLSALSWLVADADSGAVLAQHDAHRELPPASTLKTLFAVTVLPRVPANRTHLVTDAELLAMGEGSSRVGVVPGHRYRADDLWRGVFLSSGNDAVRALAEMNGGWRRTARQMQDTATRLGALDTRVVSPDGYDAEGQVSSAHDLAVFARAGLGDPAFARYCATARAKFPAGVDSRGKSGPPFEIQNTNRLIIGAPGVDPYPGIIGVKNGQTARAGSTLVGAAHRQGRTLIVTVMNPQRDSVYEEARRLLDWGFEAVGRQQPLTHLPPVPEGLFAKGGAAPVSAGAAAGGTAPGGKKGSLLLDIVCVAALVLSLAGSRWLAVRRPRREA